MLIIWIRRRMDNEITKFDMVTNWKLDCLVKGLFPIKMMNDILNDICGVGVLRIVLLKFEILEIGKTYYLKYYHIVRLEFDKS
jgi:hypothetical protein